MPATATYLVYKITAGDGQVRRTSDDTDILPPGQTFDAALPKKAFNRVPADPILGRHRRHLRPCRPLRPDRRIIPAS